MNLLPPEALVKTGDVDHADWNFRLVLGSIQQIRFKLVASFLPRQRCQRLLEIGYGSGVFMPELSRFCVELYGIDVHQEHRRVQDVLSRYGYHPELFSGDAAQMPFADRFFDYVVAVSAVEFIQDLDAACREVRRVLRPGGSFIVVTPGKSAVVDFGLKLLTGKSARRDYGDRRSRVMATLRKHFPAHQERAVPSLGTSLFRLYTGLKLDVTANGAEH